MPVGYSIYTDAPSALHQKIDPRTKLIGLMAIFVLALEFNHPMVLALLLAGVLGLGAWAQLPFKRFVPFLLGASWFVLIGVLIWPIYIQQGRPLFAMHGVQVTLDGILFGLAMGLRVALMVVTAGLWMMTTSPQRITLGLLKMGLPYRAGLAMATTIRFIPLINAERTMVIEAQRARGLRVDRQNPLARAKSSVAIVGPLALRSLDLVQSLAAAMDARGVGARQARTSLVELRMTRADIAVIAVCGIAVFAGLVMRILGVGVLVKGYL